MRILHTSDWHLGRSFHREGMLGHQGVFADHLLEVVESEQVDLVVVAGDVYDRALPPVDAVELADEVLARLAASRARVVLTSGNHDSARRLGFNARLVDAAGVHVRTVAERCDVPVELADEHGPVAVYGLPYLEPDALREAWSLPDRSHQSVLAAAMDRVRADLVRRSRGTRSVVLAHAFVAGAEPSDSERDISVGGVARVSVGTFDGVDYAALGHLHGRHTLTERVRYSGSPLAYSFSEATHRKGSWLVDLDGGGGVTAEFVDAPVPRALARLRGDLDDLLADRSLERHEQSWVQVTLTDPVRPRQAMERLRERFEHTLVIAFEPRGGVAVAAPGAVHVPGCSDHATALDFVRDVRGRAADPDEAALLLAACEACAPDAEADRQVG